METHGGVELLDFFTGDRWWAQLYRLLDRLPAWGHYKSALVMDEAWARYICDLEDAGEETPPGADDEMMSPLGYGPIVQRLDLLADRVMAVRTAVQASYSEKHEEPSFEPLPRPETALDRERERRTRSLLEEVDAQFMSQGLSLIFE